MKISIQGLKNGANFFEFDAKLETLSIAGGEFEIKKIEVKSKVDKGDHNIVVDNSIVAQLYFVCDSCLERCSDAVRDEFAVFYTTDKSSLGEDEMARLLSRTTNFIDLSEGLRESILLSLPMRFKCSDECRGLCDKCGVNLNKESCVCEKEAVDPRWEGLRKILNDSTSSN